MRQLFDHLENLQSRSGTDRRAVRLTKARYLESVGDVDAAVDVLINAAAMTGDDALPLYIAARTLAAEGRPRDAESLLVRARDMEREIRIQRVKLAEAVYQEVASAFLLAGQVDSALEVYRSAIAANPGYSLPYIRLAALLQATGRASEATDVIAALHEQAPADLDQYAYLLLQLKTAADDRSTDAVTSAAAEVL